MSPLRSLVRTEPSHGCYDSLRGSVLRDPFGRALEALKDEIILLKVVPDTVPYLALFFGGFCWYNMLHTPLHESIGGDGRVGLSLFVAGWYVLGPSGVERFSAAFLVRGEGKRGC